MTTLDTSMISENQHQSSPEENVNIWQLSDEDNHHAAASQNLSSECSNNRDLEEVLNDDDQDEDYDANLIYNDLEIFCHAIEEPQLIDLFRANKVTLGQLLEFNEEDLINCGLTMVGDRKKVLDSIAQMHCEKWVPSSLQDLTSKSLLSSPGIYISLNDINKHLEYIGITLRYLRRKLQCDPNILELGKDYVGVGKISSELRDLTKTSTIMHQQIELLGKYIDTKHLDNPIYQPANHIDKKYISRSSLKPTIIKSALFSALVSFISFKLARKLL